MKHEKTKPADARLEERLKRLVTSASGDVVQDPQQLIHELRVHQVELEVQAEELLRARGEIEKGLEQYTQLYEFAPVGYLTLDQRGAIQQVNLAGTRLLGADRGALLQRRFLLFVAEDQRAVFADFLAKVAASTAKLSCEVVIVTPGGTSVFVQIDATAAPDGQTCHLVLADATQRKRLEAELRTSEERFRTVADYTYDWEYWLAPDQTSLLYASPSCQRITGYRGEEFLRNPGLLEQIVHPEDLTRWREHCSMPVDGRTLSPLDFRIITRDGQMRWINHVCQPVYGCNGEYMGQRASNRDITDRKVVEDALQASEKFQTTVLNSLAAHLAALDASGRISAVNEPWLRFARENDADMQKIGVGADYFEVSRAAAVAGDPHAAAALDGIEAVLQGRMQRFMLEYPCHSPDTQRWFLMQVTPNVAEIGGVIITHTDITDRKHAEDALKRSEIRYRALFESAQDAIFLMQEDRVVDCNARALRIFGCAREQIIAECPWRFSPSRQPDGRDSAEKGREKIEAALAGTPQTFQWVYRQLDGAEFDAEVSLNRLELGEQPMLLAIVRDITERRRTEEELHQHRTRLEELVESRTHALEESNRDLQTAKEVAEAANRAKSIFLASMSHELRTPLNAVLGFSQIMQRDPALNEAQRENLEIINRSGAHLLDLINDVLDVSKIEAGQIALNEDVFDLWNCLQAIAEMIEGRASAKGLRFQMKQSPALPRHIRTDQKKLKQILINLAGNAVKFTDAGEVTVRVSVDAAPPLLRFEVEDTGPGIAAEQLARLFAPFSQADENREGAGLGLFISRKLVDIMAGRILVRSELGKGSVFTIEIPCQPVAWIEAAPHARGRVAGLAPGQPTPRILVAEDSRVNRLLMVKTLTSVGFEVIEAENGQQAIEVFQQQQPNLVLMDIRMPVMDGDKATLVIKATEAGKTTPIIIVSASAFDEDRQKMLATGADDFIGKPVKSDSLFEKIRLQLGVSYVYEEKAADASQARDAAALDTQVAELPPKLIEKLHAAVAALDLGRFQALMPEVAAHAADLATALEQLARAYEIARLAQIFEVNRE